MVHLEAITQILQRIKSMGGRTGYIICRSQCKKMQGSVLKKNDNFKVVTPDQKTGMGHFHASCLVCPWRHDGRCRGRLEFGVIEEKQELRRFSSLLV